MTDPIHAGRSICQVCLRPLRACICRWITPVEHAVQLVILQHPLEVRAAKGSAWLLHLSLPNSRLVIGETFDEQALQALLHAPSSMASAKPASPWQQAPYPILLYPETPAEQGRECLSHAPPDRAVLGRPEQLRLIVLDGTWRKSRKMLYLNPLLQALPRLTLADPPASRYLIRKAHKPDQLSTLEATCRALMKLENDNAKYHPLLDAFDGFVAQHAGCRE